MTIGEILGGRVASFATLSPDGSEIVPVAPPQIFAHLALPVAGDGHVLSEVQKAVAWFDANGHLLGRQDQRGLLNTLAAVVTIYYRHLRTFGETDPVQQFLHDCLIGFGKSLEIYLPALRPGINLAELEDIAAFMPDLFVELRAKVDSIQAAPKVPARSVARKPHQKRRPSTTRDLSDEVRRVRAFTRGRRLFLLGGICKNEALERIKCELDCEAVWPDAEKGAPFSRFEEEARRSDLLIALIRLSSHGYTDGLNRVSRQTGTPIIRVTGGYGSAQIAHEIYEQVLRVGIA